MFRFNPHPGDCERARRAAANANRHPNANAYANRHHSAYASANYRSNACTGADRRPSAYANANRCPNANSAILRIRADLPTRLEFVPNNVDDALRLRAE